MESDTFPGTAKVLYGYDKDNNLVIEKNAYAQTDISIYLWDELGQVVLTKKPDKYYSYLHDAHKRIQFELEKESIRGRANITAIYDINAYGKILSESGTPHTPFRYASYY